MSSMLGMPPGGMPPGGMPPGGGGMPPELDAIQEAIQSLHELMTILPDPKDTSIVAKCLQALTGIQQEMMTTRPQGAAQALVNQLSGGGPGGGGGQAPPGY